MERMMRRLPEVLLALIVAAAMALALGALNTQAAYAEGPEDEGPFFSGEFANSWHQDGWRMHDRFWIMPEDLEAPLVKDRAGNELTEGDDYELTYFRLKDDPDNLPGDNEGPDRVLEKNSEPLGAPPTEDGHYFVHIQGIGEYAGDDHFVNVLFDLGDYVIFGGEDVWKPLWANGEKKMGLVLSDASYANRVEFHIGLPREDGDGWEVELREADGCFQYDAQECALTLKGEKIFSQMEEYVDEGGNGWFLVRANVKGDGNQIVARGEYWVQLRMPRVEYRLEYDRNLLPEEDGWMEMKAWVLDEEHPEGEDRNVPITSVRIIGMEPEDGDVLEDLDREDNEGLEWSYRAANFGSATLEVKYEHADGQEHVWDEEDVVINVSDTVYEAGFGPENGVDTALPGGSITLKAWPNKKFLHWDEEDPDEYWHDQTDEGLSCQWKIEDGQELIASLKPDPADSTKAVLTFKGLPEGEDRIDENVRIAIEVKDSKSDDPDKIRAYQDEDFFVRTDYLVLGLAGEDDEFPVDVNRRLDVGDSTTVRPELWHYVMGKDAEPLDEEVAYRFEYDDNEADVTDNGNGTFTITRKTEEDFEIRLIAEWDEEGYIDREYHFDWMNYDLWLQTDDDIDTVYSDGGLDLRLESNADLEDDRYTLTYKVGTGEYEYDEDIDDDVIVWGDTIFQEDTHYEVNGTTLSLDGEALLGDLPEGEDCVIVQVTLSRGSGDGAIVLSQTDRPIWVREAWESLEQEENQNMLIGWDYHIDESINARVENSAFPNGCDFEYTVTGVTKKDENPAEAGKEVVSLDPDDNGGWTYTAQNYGNVTLVVSFERPEDLGGTEGSYEFEVNVCSEVYQVNVDTETGSYQTLPGGSITLMANGRYDTDIPDKETPEMRFEWRVDEGDWAVESLNQDAQDPAKAVVTFKDKPENDDNFYRENVRIKVSMFIGDEEVAARNIDLAAAEKYVEISPLRIENIPVGESRKITAEARRYPASKDGEEYDVLDDVHFIWGYDDNAIRIEENEGTGSSVEFTITRLKNWDTEVFLGAQWENDDEEFASMDWRYRFDRMDYGVRFDPDKTAVFDDYHTTLTLDTSEVKDMPDCSIEYEVGYHDQNNDFIRLDEAEGVFSIEDGQITIYGDALKQYSDGHGLDLHGVNVRAWPVIDGEEYSDSWCWVELKEACGNHVWEEKVTKQATCTESGEKTQTCKNDGCGEVREGIEVEPLGHDWDEGVVTTEPKCENAGVITYTCKRDATHTRTEAVNANGHKPGAAAKENVVAATCTAAGSYDNVVRCTVCKAIISSQHVDEPALGHDYQEVAGSAKAATADTNGKEADQKCTRCGDVKPGAVIPAIGGGTTPDNGGGTTPDSGGGTTPDSGGGTTPDNGGGTTPDGGDAGPADGETVTVDGVDYTVLSGSAGTIIYTKAPNKKSVTVPATVSIGGKVYKVVQIASNAFKAKKIRTVTIGKNVKTIKSKAFNKSKAGTVTVKTKLLTKKTVKGSLKGSKVKTVKVKVGSKKVNKQFIKKYGKIFTKKIAGKKVKVK